MTLTGVAVVEEKTSMTVAVSVIPTMKTMGIPANMPGPPRSLEPDRHGQQGQPGQELVGGAEDGPDGPPHRNDLPRRRGVGHEGHDGRKDQGEDGGRPPDSAPLALSHRRTPGGRSGPGGCRCPAW